MAIRTFRPYTPGTRTRVVTDFSEVTGRKPERSLVVSKHRRKGRNNRGVITCRHRGGGHKRQYRIVDFRRNKHGVPAKVAAIHYDPHRNARLALLFTPMERSATSWLLPESPSARPLCPDLNRPSRSATPCRSPMYPWVQAFTVLSFMPAAAARWCVQPEPVLR